MESWKAVVGPVMPAGAAYGVLGVMAAGVVPGAESEAGPVAAPESESARTAQVTVSATRARPAASRQRRSWVRDADLNLVLNMIRRSPRKVGLLPAAFNPG